jgi:hypothetical protein
VILQSKLSCMNSMNLNATLILATFVISIWEIIKYPGSGTFDHFIVHFIVILLVRNATMYYRGHPKVKMSKFDTSVKKIIETFFFKCYILLRFRQLGLLKS